MCLSLLLLKAWILFVDHIQPALSPYDLAICTAFFNRSSYLHFNCFYLFANAKSTGLQRVFLFITEDDPAPCKVIRTHFHPHFISRQNAYVVHPHFSGNRG